MHVLLAEGLADRDYLAKHTISPRGGSPSGPRRTPAWAAEITGLSVEQIVRFARLYGGARSFFACGLWVFPPAQWCGGHARGQLSAGGYRRLAMAGRRRAVQQRRPVRAEHPRTVRPGRRHPGHRVLDMGRLGAVLAGERRDLGDGPPVSVLLVQTPIRQWWRRTAWRLRRGLLRDDLFVCVHEQFMTDTARLADLVLPATTFLEHDDLYQASGHTFLQAARALRLRRWANAAPTMTSSASWPRAWGVASGFSARCLGAGGPGVAREQVNRRRQPVRRRLA